MSFSPKLAESFGKVLEKSPYSVQDPLVKVQTISKGSNLIFGRTLKEGRTDNLIYLGKVLENTTGKTLLGYDVWMDVTHPHVVYITGARGSGKSFDLGIIAEGVAKLQSPSPVQNGVSESTSIIVDTQSQFWTLLYPPNDLIEENRVQLESLRQWNIQPNAVSNGRIYAPTGSTISLPDQKTLAIRPSEVNHEEWCALLGQEVYGPQGHVLAKTIESLETSNYSISDMIKLIKTDAQWRGVAESTRNAVAYRLTDYERSGLFSIDGLAVTDLLVPGTCNILLLRELRNEDKAVLTSVLARQLFAIMGEHHNRRKTSQFFGEAGQQADLPNKVWLFIDEAHVVIPKEGNSPARRALVEYVKRGRDAGLSLVIATQQPSAVDDKILSQVDFTLNHRLTFQSDILAATDRIPTKIISNLKMAGSTLDDFGDMIRVLDAGQCFAGDHNTSRVLMVQMRPRVTAHGGYSPN